MPDPRSAWQPDGVHGPSRVFDASLHRWDDASWAGRDVRGAVFYELHVGTFTDEGTLDSAVARLDHLVQLGVDVVSLMPVAAFPGRWGWGYDGVDLYAVHEPYGGPQALQRFVDACHGRGLAVCLDVVYNHLGPSGNYLHGFGPYFTDKHHTPWGQAVNLDDDGSEQVRRFVVDNALRWFRDFHVDALRLDAVHALVDDSEPHLLAQLSDETASLAADLGRPLGLVAESDLNDARMVTPTARGGLGMTAQWNDDFHHAVHALTTGERQGYYVDFGEYTTLAKVLTSVFLHDGGWSTFRDADWGAPVDRTAVGGHAFLAYTQRPRPGGQPGGGRPAVAEPLPRRAGRGRRADADLARSRRCSSWARSGVRRRRGSSSPTTASRSWPSRSARVGGASSPSTAGRPRCPTRRTTRPGTPRCSTGTRSPPSRTSGCWPGTAS